MFYCTARPPAHCIRVSIFPSVARHRQTIINNKHMYVRDFELYSFTPYVSKTVTLSLITCLYVHISAFGSTYGNLNINYKHCSVFLSPTLLGLRKNWRRNQWNAWEFRSVIFFLFPGSVLLCIIPIRFEMR